MVKIINFLALVAIIIVSIPVVGVFFHILFEADRDICREWKEKVREDKRLKRAKKAYQSGSYDKETIEYIFSELEK